MNIIQSYLTTIMHGDFSLYEVRIFMKIVELANAAVKGKKYTALLGKAVSMDGISCYCEIPIRSMIPEKSHDYRKLKDALKTLKNKNFELKVPEKKEWHYTSLLNDIKIAEGNGMVSFVVPVWLMKYIMNFIDGNFSLYDLQAALALSSPRTVRLYWLTCSMTEPQEWSVEMLKRLMGVADKYPKTKDFLKRCIDMPMKELESRGLNGFTYKKIFTKNKITALRLTPVKREEKTQKQLTAMAALSAWCPPQLGKYLNQQAQFTRAELQRIKNTLFKFAQLPDYQSKIVSIVERARRSRKSKGYIVNAMKSEVDESVLH